MLFLDTFVLSFIGFVLFGGAYWVLTIISRQREREREERMDRWFRENPGWVKQGRSPFKELDL